MSKPPKSSETEPEPAEHPAEQPIEDAELIEDVESGSDGASDAPEEEPGEVAKDDETPGADEGFSETEPDNRSTTDEVSEDAVSNSVSSEVSEDLETASSQDQIAREPPAKPSTGTQGSWLGPFFAGAIAVGVGFVAAPYVLPGLNRGEVDLAQTVSDLTSRIDGLSASVEQAIAASNDNSDAIAALDFETPLNELRGRLEEIENLPRGGEASVPPEGFSALQQALASLETDLDAAAARMDEMEATQARDPGFGEMGQEALADFEAELISALETARADLEATRAAADTAEQDAAEAAARAEAQAALQFISAALVSGEAYSAQLEIVSDSGAVVPEALSVPASTGVPTLADLQESFPVAAREALEASRRAGTSDAAGDRLISFLQRQTGARSLVPKEGTDPDAVLSRSEEALRQGDVAGALAELDGLPEEGADAMSAWIALAAVRADALASADTLRQSLSNN